MGAHSGTRYKNSQNLIGCMQISAQYDEFSKLFSNQLESNLSCLGFNRNTTKRPRNGRRVFGLPPFRCPRFQNATVKTVVIQFLDIMVLSVYSTSNRSDAVPDSKRHSNHPLHLDQSIVILPDFMARTGSQIYNS
jgi:hypothetical protein